MTDTKNNTEFSSKNIRAFFVMHNARIEQLMTAGNSIKCTYYTLKSEGTQIEFTLDGFRKAMKRHRPDLHKLIAYGSQHTLAPAKPTGQKDTTVTLPIAPPVSRKWEHNKTPNEALFRNVNED